MAVGRETMMHAAEVLFADKGYSATSVRDICGASGVTQPSLYHFFGSKEKLLLELIADRYGAYCGDLDASLQGKATALDVCQAYYQFVFSRMTQAPETAKFVFSIMFGPQQDVPREAVAEHLQRSRNILTEHLRRVAKGISEKRVVFASVIAHGILTPAVLQFLVYGTTRFPEGMVEAFAQRAAAVLEDELPVCKWPEV